MDARKKAYYGDLQKMMLEHREAMKEERRREVEMEKQVRDKPLVGKSNVISPSLFCSMLRLSMGCGDDQGVGPLGRLTQVLLTPPLTATLP